MARQAMAPLLLHEFHAGRGAIFFDLNGCEAVSAYHSPAAEYQALTQGTALLDLSFRGRLCLLGADREKFLHGQVTNDVLGLRTGQGCYAALVTAKGKIESDLFIHKLPDELLLDMEPGFAPRVQERLAKYIIAEDVQVIDVAPHYGLLAVTGPSARLVLERSPFQSVLPSGGLHWSSLAGDEGEIYIVNNPRLGVPGWDLFVPAAALERTARALEESGQALGAVWAGFQACETVRIENGIPRYGADMDARTLPQEAGLEARAVSFSKGCYIGQEVIARIRTYGQVAKALRLLELSPASAPVPAPGVRLLAEGKEVGVIASAVFSPRRGAPVALAYVRKEVNEIGRILWLATEPPSEARIVAAAGGETSVGR